MPLKILREGMSRKIFKSIILAALIVMAASLLIIAEALQSFYTDAQMRQLKSEIELLAAGIELYGEEYLDRIEIGEDQRITWINNDGSVRFDSEMDAADMDNHLDREEIAQALESGSGESLRFSESLSKQFLYSAIRLSDGSVIRIAWVQSAAWAAVFNYAVPVAVVMAIAIMLSTVLAARLTKRIVKPINEMDLDHPSENNVYEELAPFVKRIEDQQRQLKKDNEVLKQNELIRQEFTANVSHELKTPLQVISGYAELIRAGMVKEEDIQPFADKIYTEAQRLTALVEDVIDLTKLDNGGSGYKWEETDIYVVAKNVIESLASAADAENVNIYISGGSVRIYTVSQLIHSIIYNLCDNAIKYNRPDGSVEVRIADGEENAYITVSDTGIGIPREYLDRIFERFYRVDKSRSKEVRGTGLGLSIVKRAMKIIDADISVESKEGSGTVFTVKLPHKVAYLFKNQ